MKWHGKLEDRIACDGIDVFDEKGRRVACVPPDDTMEIEDGQIVEVCSPERQRVAQVIIAAPQLLAALRRLTDRVDPATKSSQTIKSFSEAITEARAALALVKS